MHSYSHAYANIYISIYECIRIRMRMLIYALIYRCTNLRTHTRARERVAAGVAPGPRFTCFTSTKVQILTRVRDGRWRPAASVQDACCCLEARALSRCGNGRVFERQVLSLLALLVPKYKHRRRVFERQRRGARAPRKHRQRRQAC